MMTRGSGIVGNNVQTAVDAKHRLIVEHEVTNTGSDRDQLPGMAKKARTAIGTTELTVPGAGSGVRQIAPEVHSVKNLSAIERIVRMSPVASICGSSACCV